MKPYSSWVQLLFAATLGILRSAGLSAPQFPENLALHARISASSEYSSEYRASLVADGHIPAALSREDLGRAWCVKGETHRQHAEISFSWQKPIELAEIVYYGRTAWFLEECWKDYEVFLNDAKEPVLRGRFEMQHGPQAVSFATPLRASKVRMVFTSSYGGLNPGASEIQIFPRTLTAAERIALGRSKEAVTKPVSPGALRRLVRELRQRHGSEYAEAEKHERALEVLTHQANDDEPLRQLQRDVLLFDVKALLVIKRHEINASHVYTYHNEGFRAGGGLYLVEKSQLGKARQLVPSPTGQVLDCDLSYDGKTALFSWRQREDEGYHLWAVRLDGSEPRQLTRGEWHDYNGCWLPDGGIAFVSTRNAQFAYCWNSPVGVVHRMNADGSEVQRLSGNYLNDFTPYPLADGRIIYTRWEYVDKPAIPIQSLWTINPDGTGLAGYFGNRVLSPGTFMEARSVPGTELIVCTMTGHNGPTRGAIGLIDRRKGVNAQEAIRNLTLDVGVPRVNEGSGNFEGSKPYSSPFPLDQNRLLLSARGPVLVRDFSGECEALVLEAPDDGMQWFNAQPVRARAKPPVVASTLPNGAEPKGVFVLQDVYAGLEGFVRRGEIKRLRVVREMPKTVRINPDKRAFGFQFPVISCGATYAGKDVLGEVEVDSDGSACFEVPAGIPVYFMALDGEGRAVQRMRSFTHLMPGETQSCVGCHDTRTPNSPAASPSSAFKRAAKKLDPPEWGRGGFDYARIVQPVLDEHCARCHSGQSAQGRVDLSGDLTDYFNVSYETLARGRKESGEAQWDNPYVSWIPSYNGFEQNILQVAPKSWGSPRSKLADLILDGHPDKDGQRRVNLDDQSRRRILAWIDLNVPYYGSSETTHPEALGSRRVYPPELDRTLADVALRRCASCHTKIPRQFWTRIGNPQLNSFLLAPLAKAAGGTSACGMEIFQSASDPDYQAILKTFDNCLESLKRTPRNDMPGAKCSQFVSRSCK